MMQAISTTPVATMVRVSWNLAGTDALLKLLPELQIARSRTESAL
jgi:hypothetical protein